MRTRSTSSLALITSIFACLALAAVGCGDSKDDTTTTTTTTSASSSGTTTTTTTSGSGGGGGGGGACSKCKELVEKNLPPTDACKGNTEVVIGALIKCLCAPDVCGGPGKGCEAACTKGDKPDAACLACDQTAFAGVCKTEGEACFADM